MILYPRGFVITRDEFDLPESMGHYVLRQVGGLKFYSDVRTDTSIAFSDNKFVILHGHAWLYSGENGISDHAEIAQSLADSYAKDGEIGLEESIKWLGGRYVVVVGSQHESYTVYHDAHGMRSIYFDIESGLVSSHYQLIRELTGEQSNELHGSKQAPLWTRWNKTKSETIFALIPNHKYKEASSGQDRYYPTSRSDASELSENQRIELIETLWKSQLAAYIDKHKIVMSMTGGLDSRVTVALAKEHLSQLPAFTYTHDSGTSGSSGSWRLDKEIVNEILEVVPVNHKILRYEDRGRLTPEQILIADRNSIVMHGRWILTLYPEVFEDSNTLHLRSNTHETARAYYARRENDDQLDRIARIVAGGAAASLNFNAEEKKAEFEKAKTALKEFGYSNNQMKLEPLDLFYWEFRMGRWVSEVYNETDNSFETFTPFNMRGMVELALGFSYHQRLDGYLFKELINRNLPILNFFRMNGQENLYEINREKINQINELQKQSPPASLEKGDVDNFKNSSSEVKYTTSIHGVSGPETQDRFLSIPAHALEAGNSSSTNYEIGSGQEIVLEYLNTYKRKAAQGYLAFEMIINGQIVQQEDIIAHWDIQTISIRNSTNETINLTFQIVALKNCVSESWEKASRTWIKTILNETTKTPNSNSVIVERRGTSSIFSLKDL